MWYRFGQWLVRRTETRWNRVLFVTGIGLLSALFESVLDTWLTQHAGKDWRLMLDAGSIGLLVGSITYVEILAVQHRRKRIATEMQMVAELNHSVRNALQTIAYAARLPETENQVEIIEDCVRRIDRTLHDLFPAPVPDRFKRSPLAADGRVKPTHFQ